jgi:hypothetical protein
VDKSDFDSRIDPQDAQLQATEARFQKFLAEIKAMEEEYKAMRAELNASKTDIATLKQDVMRQNPTSAGPNVMPNMSMPPPPTKSELTAEKDTIFCELNDEYVNFEQESNTATKSNIAISFENQIR